MIDNWYVIRLAKLSVPKVNVVKNPTSDICIARLEHLSYRAMQKQAFVALGMELKSPIPSEICGGYRVAK